MQAAVWLLVSEWLDGFYTPSPLVSVHPVRVQRPHLPLTHCPHPLWCCCCMPHPVCSNVCPWSGNVPSAPTSINSWHKYIFTFCWKLDLIMHLNVIYTTVQNFCVKYFNTFIQQGCVKFIKIYSKDFLFKINAFYSSKLNPVSTKILSSITDNKKCFQIRMIWHWRLD